MGVRLSDTHPAVAREQIRLLRAASVAQRAGRALSLTRTTFQLALRALRRRRPELGPDELFVRFVAIHYGRELARGLRRDVERRGRLSP